MDIALKQQSNGIFDIEFNGPDLLSDNGMRTSICISLFSNRQAELNDELTNGSNNRQGWWADSFALINGDLIGSRLWLLAREKQTQNVLQKAKDYTLEALQWLLNDGVVSQIIVTPQWHEKGILAVRVQLFKANNQPFDQVFEYSLEAL